MPLRKIEIALFSFQILHLSAYLGLIFKSIYSTGWKIKNNTAESFQVSVSRRVSWLKILGFCFSVFGLVVLGDFIYMFNRSSYSPTANYLFTLAMSGIIYVIAYQAVLKMDVIVAGFSRKYGGASISSKEASAYVEKLSRAIRDHKPYLDPDIRLEQLADLIDISPHRLSQLLNDRFNSSFFEFVNSHRIEETKRLLRNPEYSERTILSIANEAGFNSKSSFNKAFKDQTGLTPSEYRDRNR